MATLSVLSFNAEGRPIQFDAWLDDLQLYLLSDSRDGVSLFDLTSGASLAPPDTADTERAHFDQHKTAKALYDAVVARYSSPATTALGCLILPYLLPELSAFTIVADLITHLRTSDTRYCAVLPAEFLAKNPPPMYITLYYIVTRLTDSLSAVRDLLLALDPTYLTVHLLEKHLLAAENSIVAVSASGPVAPPCSCRLLSHLNLLWHHRLGHPSLPRLRGMHSRLLVSGFPRSLPPLPPSPATACLPCIEVRQRAAPHSSFPHMTSPLQTLHMDMWGPAHVSGQGRECYFLLVVDDYMRYTTVFPLHSKGEDPDVLIPWIRAVRLQLRERFHQDLPVLRLHSDRGGEFSSDLLRDFCRGEGILQSFTLPASPQQNGIAERRIGLVMEVARTSMIHGAAPPFLWPFAVRYALHPLNLWPRVSLPEFSPTLCWTGKVGDASVFWVWGSRALVRDTSAVKFSAHAILCVFLGFPPDAPGWQFYHPTSCRVIPSQNVTLDESAPFYRLFPYRSAPPPPLPLFLAPGPPLLDPLTLQGPAPSRVSQLDPLSSIVPVEVAIGSSAARGAAPGGAASGGAASGGVEPGGAESEGAGSGGAEPGVAEPGGAEPTRVEPGGAEPACVEPGGTEHEVVELGGAKSEGAESRGAELRGTSSFGGHADSAAGDIGAGGVGATRLGGTGVSVELVVPESGGAGAGGTGAGGAGAGGAGPGDIGAGCAGAGGTSAGGAGAGGVAAVDPGAGGAGARGTGLVALELEELDLLTLDLGVLCLVILPASRPPSPSPYCEQTGGLTEHRALESRLASPVRAVCTGRRVPCPRPPSLPGTHAMALCPSSVPLRVPLPPPPKSSLPAVPDPGSDLARSARSTVSRLLTTVVTDPPFESTAASTLAGELLDVTASCRLDYATALVAKSESASRPSVGGECALGTNVLEDRQKDFECLAAAIPSFASMLLAPKGDSDAPGIPTPRSYVEAITGTYVDAVPPSRANIVGDMWIFRVKRSPGSPPAFKARYVARGFSEQQGVDYFQTFSPTPKTTTLRVLLHVATQRDYELHSLDFSSAFLQGNLHEEIWLRRPPGFTRSIPASTQWSLGRPVYGLHQAPREWHDTLRTTFAALGFTPSTADPSLFLRTDTSLPPFYILVYIDDLVLKRFGFLFSSPQSTPLSTGFSLSAPPSDESVEPIGPYPELVGCLMYLMTCTRPDFAYPLSLVACYVAPDRHGKVYWDAAKRVLRYLCSTSGMGLELGGRGPIVLTGHVDASWFDDLATHWVPALFPGGLPARLRFSVPAVRLRSM
ncbi:unnamed protein product [Closterium sp. NIES-54]